MYRFGMIVAHELAGLGYLPVFLRVVIDIISHISHSDWCEAMEDRKSCSVQEQASDRKASNEDWWEARED